MKKRNLFFYDENHGNKLLYRGKTGTSDNFKMPENATFDDPGEIPQGKIAIFKLDGGQETIDLEENISVIVKTGHWEKVPETNYIIDSNGFFVEKEVAPTVGKLFVNEVPPALMVKPRWNGKKWESCLVPAEMIKPIWNAGKWQESASNDEIRHFVNNETEQKILAEYSQVKQISIINRVGGYTDADFTKMEQYISDCREAGRIKKEKLIS